MNATNIFAKLDNLGAWTSKVSDVDGAKRQYKLADVVNVLHGAACSMYDAKQDSKGTQDAFYILYSLAATRAKKDSQKDEPARRRLLVDYVDTMLHVMDEALDAAWANRFDNAPTMPKRQDAPGAGVYRTHCRNAAKMGLVPGEVRKIQSFHWKSAPVKGEGGILHAEGKNGGTAGTRLDDKAFTSMSMVQAMWKHAPENPKGLTPEKVQAEAAERLATQAGTANAQHNAELTKETLDLPNLTAVDACVAVGVELDGAPAAIREAALHMVRQAISLAESGDADKLDRLLTKVNDAADKANNPIRKAKKEEVAAA